MMISRKRLVALRDQYLKLVKLEVEELGVKPTEVRHLIGRLGEFHCAIKVRGELAHRANQHGFDVTDRNGRRISVKITAQKSGFVAISATTLHCVHDLMLLQYVDGNLECVYYGPIKKVVSEARSYPHARKFELDISKARALGCTDTKVAAQQRVAPTGRSAC